MDHEKRLDCVTSSTAMHGASSADCIDPNSGAHRMKFSRHTLFAGTLLASLSSLAAGVVQAQSPPEPRRTQTAAAAQVSAAAQASTAETEKAYRRDAARHIYAAYPDKIYKGKLPPMVHAIVMLEMDVDAKGQLKNINLIRTPTHAPEVTNSVLEMIRRASPMPAPKRMGGAKFTEIWLVDKSGRFQLDALTQGQR
jgi:periplasmic protein TonB